MQEISMKAPGKKGISMPMEVIIGIVILIVIALAVIMFTSGSITQTGTKTDASGTTANDQIMCTTQATGYCNANPSETECTGGETGNCPKCTSSVFCSAYRSGSATE